MPNQPYQGYLNKQCTTLAEVLKASGYLMTGKWHLGYHDTDNWPLQRALTNISESSPELLTS